jgi:hypothetical protein
MTSRPRHTRAWPYLIYVPFAHGSGTDILKLLSRKPFEKVRS